MGWLEKAEGKAEGMKALERLSLPVGVPPSNLGRHILRRRHEEVLRGGYTNEEGVGI